MSGGRGRRVSGLFLVAAIVTAPVAVAGCGSGGAAQPAGTTAQTGPLTAAKLRSALLTRINGVAAAAPAAYGSYASLSGVLATAKTAHGLSVHPKACAKASLTGLDSAVLVGAPAAAVTFRVGRNGVSEMLVAAPAAVAAKALSSHIPAKCAHYRVTIDGKTFRYTVKESAIEGIGEQARALNVKTAGTAADDVWSVIYRGDGFLGEVTVVGPNASELAVRQLGQQAYAYAAKTLS